LLIQLFPPLRCMALEGKLVEILGSASYPLATVGSSFPSEPQQLPPSGDDGVDPNGAAGIALRWNSDDCTYLVQTFDGAHLVVKQDNLREFHPEAPEKGGFDLSWPQDAEEAPRFALLLADLLARKGFCVVQTYLTPQERQAAVDQSFHIPGWSLPKKDLEAAYLGRNNTTKFVMLPRDALDELPALQSDSAITDGSNADFEQDGRKALQRADSLLTEVGLLLEPMALSRLGFSAWGRMNGLLRSPLAQGDEELLRPRPLSQMDYEDGKVLGHINFLECRKVAMLLLIQNDGGEVTLHRHDAPGGPQIHLPLCANRMLLFRSDIMGYCYGASGPSLALQSWLLSEPLAPDPDDARVARLPSQLHGEQVHIMSTACHYPGNATGRREFWDMVVNGTDALTRVPLTRWDFQEYYSADAAEGFTYAVHGSFCSEKCVVMFDNDFFGVSEEEARIMSPGQRLVLQTGYEALQQAGITKKLACGLACGVFLGDSGNEWPRLFAHLPGPQQMLGSSNCVTGSRLAHILGLRGPCSVTDTACSSSLVAIGLAHMALRNATPQQPESNITSHVNTALAQGCNLILSPRMYILYSGPHMLSPRGRCFTFDSSADGYARGEGCGSLVLKTLCSNAQAQDSLACLIGSAVNQDGRSASMTAPNGPSQQQCIRSSMVESSLSASEITVAECHGTGTALGDPIEVSALRMVMQDRKLPILNTSAKTNLGHLEASAGMAGFLKCINLLNSSCAPPNNHFRFLNPHMDTNGYPVYFNSELTDYGCHTGISGVSSFGFGGTNARADLWARCLRGSRSTVELDTGEWMQQRSLYFQRIYHYGSPGPHPSDQVYVSGSWDAYSSLQAMEQRELGEYVATVNIGETRCEHFHLVVNQDPNQVIHPSENLSGRHSASQGPDTTSKANWLISGKLDDVPAGTSYQIRLRWGFSWERGEYKLVTWEPVGIADAPKASLRDFRHQYAIVASWTAWQFQDMVMSREDVGLWTTSLRIGLSGQEEFQFARDKDWAQVIHPAAPKASDTSIRLTGPDNGGHGMNWFLQGRIGEVVTIQLRIVDGDFTVTMASETNGIQSWHSRSCEDDVEESFSDKEPLFLLSGTWNGWGTSAMRASRCLDEGQPIVSGDAHGSTGRLVFRHILVLGDRGFEEFQVIMDSSSQPGTEWQWRFPRGGSSQQRLYPHKEQACLGEGILCGPDSSGHGRNWRIDGVPGQKFQVLLDPGQDDSRKVVWWQEVQGESLLDA